MDRIIYHIGLHKTGTTFLQKYFFPRLNNTTYVHGQVPIMLLPNYQSHPNWLISHEILGGNPFSSKWISEFEKNIKFLLRVTPASHFIMGIREQSSLIESLYAQFLHQGGYIKFDDFFSLGNNSLVKTNDLLLLPRIEHLLELAPKHGLFLYDQKDLVEMPETVLKSMSKFVTGGECNVDIASKEQPNTSVGHYQAKILRRLNSLNHLLTNHSLPSLNNRVFRRLRMNPRPLCQERLKFISKKRFDIGSVVKERIANHYEKDYTKSRTFIDYLMQRD